MIGKLLGGRYQVVDIIGGGGFGKTYVALDIHRPGSPKCVLKHLKPASNNSGFLQNARRLFQSEAETLEKLGNHDQIPRLLAYFEENQEFYLVQDFIQGHPLSAELQPGQRWTESQVCQLLEEILGILVFVHSHGVIHRDIKPSNLIQCQQDNKLVLVDFGSVKQAWTQVVTAQGKTRATFAIGIPATIGIGTPGYMPIEQGRGRPRPNSDIYALGIIGIQALTGLHPMQIQEEPDTGELLWQHQAQVSNALASILTKMVRYHFKDRYQTAAEALQALQIIVNEESSRPALFVNSQATSPTAICPNPSLPTAASISAPQPTVLLPPEPQAPYSNQKMIADSPSNSVDLKENHPSIPATHNQSHLRIGAGITAILISVVVGYAISWQPSPSIQKTLEQIETLKAEGKSEECVNQTPTDPQDSRFYTDAQAFLYKCQIAKARRLAAERKFKEAITEAGKIPQDATFYQEAQQLINQWSAQAAIKQWNREWKNNKKALAEDKRQNAKSVAKKVIATTKRKEKIQPIIQKAESKIAEFKTAVTSQPTRTNPRRLTGANRPPTRTIPRRLTLTTPRRLIRANRPLARITPKLLKRTTPRRLIRANRRLARITPKLLKRSAPPKRSYKWTTETVP